MQHRDGGADLMVLGLPIAVFLVMLVVYIGMHLVLVRPPQSRNRSLMTRPSRRPTVRRPARHGRITSTGQDEPPGDA